MKFTLSLFLILLLIGCNDSQPDKLTPGSVPDSSKSTDIVPKAPENKIQDSHKPGKDQNDTLLTQADMSLLTLAEQVLKTIKSKDYARLSTFIDQQKGVRFSPYAFVDTVHDQLINSARLMKIATSKERVLWGLDDAKETPIKLSIDDYFNKVVYAKDFLKAPQKRVNNLIDKGNTLNNAREVYPGCDVIDFHFPGFEPQYEGMDWLTLRLVFKTEGNKKWLLAIIHDEWTI